ncbi:hypothetical protein R1flu_020255 [Riccia fluitans]|uniref:Uncharacterized protein n=1 Tax=Riccia fluitans TaxID=41844 RepID=A0ABD1ZKZ3_9MARC
MQRVNSGVFTNILPSAQKPPRVPTSKARSSQMDPARFRDGGFGRGSEKDEKRRWKLRADHAVHLVPVVLLACLFVLYICSSLPVEGSATLTAAGLNQGVRTGTLHRRLLGAGPIAVDEGTKSTTMVTREVRVTEHDLHRLPLRLRGGHRHF